MADDEHSPVLIPDVSTAPSGNAFGYEMSKSSFASPPSGSPNPRPLAEGRTPLVRVTSSRSNAHGIFTIRRDATEVNDFVYKFSSNWHRECPSSHAVHKPLQTNDLCTHKNGLALAASRESRISPWKLSRQWRRSGSNRQPLPCKGSALPIELRPHRQRWRRNGSRSVDLGNQAKDRRRSHRSRRRTFIMLCRAHLIFLPHRNGQVSGSGRTWIRTKDLIVISDAL